MKVCFVCLSLETLGGLQRAVVLLSNELVRRGLEVAVLMDKPDLGKNPYGLNQRVHVLDIGIAGPSRPWGELASKFRRHLGYPRPSRAAHELGGSVIDREGFAKVQEALASGGFDVVVGCDPLHTIVASYACRDSDVCACGWQHSTYEGYFCHRRTYFFGLEGLFRDALKVCDVNFVLTDESRKVYERETGFPATVLPNSITSLGERSREKKCILYCGRLDSFSKGADYLPAIASGLADAGFDGLFQIVGDGPYRYELERWVAGSNLPFQMNLTGFVTNAGKYYSHASVLVSPSRWEGFGLSILEAMSHGVPCIAFDNDGPRSIITDGKDGVIAPNGSVEDLVKEAMLLITDDEMRTRMGNRAVETARGYLVSRQADAFLKALEGCGR